MGCVDDLRRQLRELVEGFDSFDLSDQPIHESEVPACDAHDRRDRCGVGDPAVFRFGAVGEAPGENGGELVGGQGSVFVGGADAAVELRVAGEPFLDAGHADEDDAQVVPVEEVADLLEARCFEAVCFVDDEQLGEAA